MKHSEHIRYFSTTFGWVDLCHLHLYTASLSGKLYSGSETPTKLAHPARAGYSLSGWAMTGSQKVPSSQACVHALVTLQHSSVSPEFALALLVFGCGAFAHGG